MIDLSVKPSRRKAVTAHVLMGAILQGVYVVQSLAIVPLCVSKIGTGPFGFWLATGGVLSWLAVANFGSAGLTMQRCAAAYGRHDLQAVRDWFMHGMVMAAFSAAVLIAILLPLATLAPAWLGATGSLAGVLTAGMLVAGAGAALTPLNDTARGMLCGLQRNGIAMGAEVVAGVIGLAFTLSAVFFGWGIAGLAWGSALRILVALAINGGTAALYVSKAARATQWSSAMMGEYGRTLVPLWSSSVVVQMLPQLPLVVLAKMMGPEAGPLASLAYTATMRPIILVEMLTMHGIMSTSTAISHLVEDPNSADTAAARIRTMSSAAYAAIAAGVILYCFGAQGFVDLWVGKEAFLGPLFVFAAAVASFSSMQLRSLMNLGASLGLVSSTAMLQAVEGVARAVAMIVAVAFMGPIGIPLATIVFTLMAGALVESRLIDHRGFPSNGTGRLVWLARAVGGCAVASASSGLILGASWPTWIARMIVATLVVVAAALIVSPEIRGWLTTFRRRLAVGGLGG
jgi:hypothetical protein